MRVAGKRERRRVVAEGAAELEQVGPSAQMERGERVTERVEARPRSVYLLDQRLEPAATEVAGLDRVAVPVGEHERRGVLIVQRGEIGAQAVDEGRRQPNLALAVLRLRRLDPPLDHRATDADLGLGAVDLQVEALERDRLADPQAAGRQDLEQQLVGLRGHRENRGKLLPAEHLDLLLLVRELLAVGKRQPLAWVVADQALAVRG